MTTALPPRGDRKPKRVLQDVFPGDRAAAGSAFNRAPREVSLAHRRNPGNSFPPSHFWTPVAGREDPGVKCQGCHSQRADTSPGSCRQALHEGVPQPRSFSSREELREGEGSVAKQPPGAGRRALDPVPAQGTSRATGSKPGGDGKGILPFPEDPTGL